jgi:GNAT superfamily N-acetyltransferase
MSALPAVEGTLVDVRRVNDDADFEQLHALLLEYEAALPPDLRHGVVGDLATVRTQYGDPHAAFVALDGARAAGCIGVMRRDERDALVLRLYVRPEQRGRAVARLLVEAALAFARACGFERAVLDTDKTRLAAAYALYESLGFTECAPYGPVDYASPTYMELRLR